MIIKILLEQSCADSKAADDFEALVLSTFPDAQIRGSRGEYFKLGAARVAEEARRQTAVREIIETEVRAETTDTIQQETIEALVAGTIIDPRITITAQVEVIEG